jgi:hypothetical protein
MRSPLARDRRQPPGFIRPALPVLAATVPAGDGWIHELKARWLRDRRVDARIILDGEAVAHCPKGLPDYSRSARRVVLREPSQAWRELSTRPLKQHRGVGDENDVRAAPQLVSGECAALDALQDAPREAIGKVGDKLDIRHSGTDTDRSMITGDQD